MSELNPELNPELNLVIADDEPLAISNLKAKLAGYPRLKIVACFDNGDDTLHYLRSHKVDLVLLDIQMPGIKGIDILKKLQKTSAMSAPLLVLVTAYEHYALPAFEHLAFDYLLKPVSRARLAQCLQDAATALQKTTASKPVATTHTTTQATTHAAATQTVSHPVTQAMHDRAPHGITLNASAAAITAASGDSNGNLATLGQGTGVAPHDVSATAAAQTGVHHIAHGMPLQPSEKMLFRSGASAHLLDESDIMHIEAAGNYMCVQTIRQNLVVRETLKELLKRLPSHFVQVHRSTLVNLHHVHQIQPHNNDYMLQLSNGKQVIASRRYKQNWQPLLYLRR